MYNFNVRTFIIEFLNTCIQLRYAGGTPTVRRSAYGLYDSYSFSRESCSTDRITLHSLPCYKYSGKFLPYIRLNHRTDKITVY